MPVILGIAHGHNASICLIKDGSIIFCQSEERLNRIKNSLGFPMQTLDYLYKNVISPEEIDEVILYQTSLYGYLHLKSIQFQPKSYGYYLDEIYSAGGSGVLRKIKRKVLKTHIGWDLREEMMSEREDDPKLRIEAMNYYASCARVPVNKVSQLDHHTSHAFSVVPNIQDWKESLIFTLDGVGDSYCATVFMYQNGDMTKLTSSPHKNSLGYYYSATTCIMGMKSGEHEFKVMGMAPYAKKVYYQEISDKLFSLLDIDQNGNWVSQITPDRLIDKLTEIYRYKRFDNIAGAIQELTEERTQKWIKYWIGKTGCHNIALTGGVFMNVKACQKIVELPEVKKAFVMPSAADESTAIGCAVYGSVKRKVKVTPFTHLYFGMNFSDEQIEEVLKKMNADDDFQISRPVDMAEVVSELLLNNEIVARCAGPMEFGARALGNRSILANPSDFTNVQKINDAIKSRDFWMPFTPSIMEEEIPRYIQNYEKIYSPYMCITFNSTEIAKKHLVAAMHPKDKTIRPQTVSKSWNPEYYAIIEKFKEKSGIGAVLNTSFNLHGEPNVCSPQDALRTVLASGLNYLVLGSFLLEKKVKSV